MEKKNHVKVVVDKKEAKMNEKEAGEIVSNFLNGLNKRIQLCEFTINRIVDGLNVNAAKVMEHDKEIMTSLGNLKAKQESVGEEQWKMWQAIKALELENEELKSLLISGGIKKLTL